jgi:hypothetical protein
LPCVMDILIAHPVIDAARQEHPVPTRYEVLRCYPNPFNSNLAIELPEFTGSASLSIFDLLGRRVSVESIDASRLRGSTLYRDFSGQATGVYFIRMESGTKSYLNKVQFIR